MTTEKGSNRKSSDIKKHDFLFDELIFHEPELIPLSPTFSTIFPSAIFSTIELDDYGVSGYFLEKELHVLGETSLGNNGYQNETIRLLKMLNQNNSKEAKNSDHNLKSSWINNSKEIYLHDENDYKFLTDKNKAIISSMESNTRRLEETEIADNESPYELINYLKLLPTDQENEEIVQINVEKLEENSSEHFEQLQNNSVSRSCTPHMNFISSLIKNAEDFDKPYDKNGSFPSDDNNTLMNSSVAVSRQDHNFPTDLERLENRTQQFVTPLENNFCPSTQEMKNVYTYEHFDPSTLKFLNGPGIPDRIFINWKNSEGTSCLKEYVLKNPQETTKNCQNNSYSEVSSEATNNFIDWENESGDLFYNEYIIKKSTEPISGAHRIDLEKTENQNVFDSKYQYDNTTENSSKEYIMENSPDMSLLACKSNLEGYTNETISDLNKIFIHCQRIIEKSHTEEYNRKHPTDSTLQAFKNYCERWNNDDVSEVNNIFANSQSKVNSNSKNYLMKAPTDPTLQDCRNNLRRSHSREVTESSEIFSDWLDRKTKFHSKEFINDNLSDLAVQNSGDSFERFHDNDAPTSNNIFSNWYDTSQNFQYKEYITDNSIDLTSDPSRNNLEKLQNEKIPESNNLISNWYDTSENFQHKEYITDNSTDLASEANNLENWHNQKIPESNNIFSNRWDTTDNSYSTEYITKNSTESTKQAFREEYEKSHYGDVTEFVENNIMNESNGQKQREELSNLEDRIELLLAGKTLGKFAIFELLNEKAPCEWDDMTKALEKVAFRNGDKYILKSESVQTHLLGMKKKRRTTPPKKRVYSEKIPYIIS